MAQLTEYDQKILAEYHQRQEERLKQEQAEKVEITAYWQNRKTLRTATKPVHLTAKDDHYCCSIDAKVKSGQSTSDPAKSTCKHCNHVFVAYWTAPFFRMAYEDDRGVNAVPFFEPVKTGAEAQ